MNDVTQNRNATFVGDAYTNDLHSEMEWFDGLPAPIRRLLWDSPERFSAQQVAEEGLAFLDAEGIPRRDHARLVAQWLCEAAHAELRQFAEQFREKYGAPLHHLAAGASITRYHDHQRFGRKRGRLNKPRKQS